MTSNDAVKKLKILIIDDDASVGESLLSLLSLTGYEVKTLQDSSKALDTINHFECDLIICDYNMPAKSGIEVLKEIREDPRFNSIPVIMLTSEASQLIIGKCFDQGASDYVSKPVRSVELRARVKAILDTSIEKRKYKNLLQHVIPKSLCEKYLHSKIDPKHHSLITVGFVDIVNFTSNVSKMDPTDVIKILSDYFTEFDSIMEKRGLLSIKTIGDAYMFSGGTEASTSTHTLDCILASIDILKLIQSRNTDSENYPWDVRIGLHSGPVVSGIIYGNKIAYDLWGHTVNFAQRLESTAPINRVHVSKQVTLLASSDDFSFEKREKTFLEGIGEEETFLVKVTENDGN